MTVDREDVTEKATFQKIKEYVKEKYGLNVDTKYIAEVMRKHGLPMHEAPNKVASLFMVIFFSSQSCVSLRIITSE